MNVQSRYLDIDVHTAPPALLVARLLARAAQAARAARGAEPGAQRTRNLGRALEIISELRRSLDFVRGAEIAVSLERLYGFASEQLLAGAASRDVREIDAALAALEPIAEAFAEIARGAPAADAPAQADASEPRPRSQVAP